MPMKEKELYPRVATWLKTAMKCYATGTDTGLRNARIDAIGIRDVGGDLSGSIEVIAVEVKRGVTPFGNAVGQAHSYSAYADRCYLAGIVPFDDEKLRIASHLGVGLLSITTNARGARQVREILSAPLSRPLDGLRLEVVEKLGYSLCTLCRAVFKRGTKENWSENVSRARSQSGSLLRAVKSELGFVYWLEEASGRDTRPRSRIYRRRYVCADCVWNLFRDFVPFGATPE